MFEVPATATTTVLATIRLQLAALFTSTVFLSILMLRGGQVFSLSLPSYCCFPTLLSKKRSPGIRCGEPL
jgi:hypothetical protein